MYRLLGFFMNRVLAVKLAVFFLLKTSGSVSFLLGRRVVSALALGAFQCDNLTHFKLRNPDFRTRFLRRVR